MAYRNESWGERDSRRWCWWIVALLVASAALGIVRLTFGIGAKLLFYLLAMLFLLIIGIVVPVFVIGFGALVVQLLRRIKGFLR